ncbi:hypothetical protein C8Q80DRAFT_1106258 [Daedaleopsis nitida]|nr:hypothetical protein C8Q80DRAFT_1106258 [Daedaleopsis nitida]
MALGGLGAILLSGHPSLSPSHVLSKVDLRSALLAVVLVIIVFVLAYLTNPSETSFRTYLTELSFKQHLSRLDDGGSDESAASDDYGVHFSLSRRPTAGTRKGSNFDPTSPFHFVNRASVSLRTPKHVFYSFGVLTIAAVYPTGRPNLRRDSYAVQADNLSSLVSDAWYIGAFGRWWRGGIIQSWWHEMLANTKDAEKCGSGILDVKALDILEGLDGLPLPTSSRIPQNGPPKLKSAHRCQNSISRSSSPPPLPKTASLPLHVPRVPASTPPKANGTQSLRHASTPAQTSAPVTPESRFPAPPVLAHSPSSASLWDSSPIIAEVLRQISASKIAVGDLRQQLEDFRNAAAETRAGIQSELDIQRDRKREEDAARAELKGRTKTLEDSKRSAESSKRDAEKRLKAAETARDRAAERIERLGEEIGALKCRMREDEAVVVECREEGDEQDGETQEELERKKKEIKVAEEVVAALNMRAKELEERIAQEEERLRRSKEQAELRRQDRSFYPLTVVPAVNEDDLTIPSWSYANQSQDVLTQHSAETLEPQLPFPRPVHAPKSQGSSSSGSGSSDNRDVSVSPRPARLSLTGISNLREAPNRVLPDPDPNGQVLLRTRGFPLLSGDLSSTHSTSTRFSPFGDSDDAEPTSSDLSKSANSISPISSSYIPSSLISSLDSSGSFDNFGLARSFQSEDDTVLSRDWRKNTPFPPPLPVESPGTGSGLYTTSPSSLSYPTFDGVDREDVFEVRLPPFHRRLTSDEAKHALPSSRTISDPPPPPVALTGSISENENPDKIGLAHRRWSSQQDAAEKKKGLNPEAKAFSLTQKSYPSLFSTAQVHGTAFPQSQAHLPFEFDPLGNGSGASHAPLSTPAALTEPDTLFSSISMRAFAPSPAEREALQRALGGSTNTSLERLPTLSEVSIPPVPSPSHTHTAAADHAFGAAFGIGGGRTLLGPGLSWLQSLPRVRKPKFSPWEDEEPKELEAGAPQ